MVGELPERYYVAQLNKTVAVFANKQSIPTDFYEDHVVIPEDAWSQDDLETKRGTAYVVEVTPSAIPHYQALGVQYPGALGVALQAAILALTPIIMRIIMVIGAIIIAAIVANLVLSRSVTPMDIDGDGVVDKYNICTWMGCVVYDPVTGRTDDLGGGFGDIINTAVILIAVAGGAYIVFKLVLPGVAEAMKSTAKGAYGFAKRESKAAYEYGKEQFR